MSATKLREKVNSIADLRLLVNIPVGKVIETDSYYGDGKGGGNTFIKVVTGAQVDNGGTIIVGADLGVYEAIEQGVADIRQFGGKANDDTFDNAAVMRKMVSENINIVCEEIAADYYISSYIGSNNYMVELTDVNDGLYIHIGETNFLKLNISTADYSNSRCIIRYTGAGAGANYNVGTIRMKGQFDYDAYIAALEADLLAEATALGNENETGVGLFKGVGGFADAGAAGEALTAFQIAYQTIVEDSVGSVMEGVQFIGSFDVVNVNKITGYKMTGQVFRGNCTGGTNLNMGVLENNRSFSSPITCNIDSSTSPSMYLNVGSIRSIDCKGGLHLTSTTKTAGNINGYSVAKIGEVYIDGASYISKCHGAWDYDIDNFTSVNPHEYVAIGWAAWWVPYDFMKSQHIGTMRVKGWVGTYPYNNSGGQDSTIAGAFEIGQSYTIMTVGTTDFTAIGASSNTVGVIFTATGVGTGTGTAKGKITSTELIIDYLDVEDTYYVSTSNAKILAGKSLNVKDVIFKDSTEITIDNFKYDNPPGLDYRDMFGGTYNNAVMAQYVRNITIKNSVFNNMFSFIQLPSYWMYFQGGSVCPDSDNDYLLMENVDFTEDADNGGLPLYLVRVNDDSGKIKLRNIRFIQGGIEQTDVTLFFIIDIAHRSWIETENCKSLNFQGTSFYVVVGKGTLRYDGNTYTWRDSTTGIWYQSSYYPTSETDGTVLNNGNSFSQTGTVLDLSNTNGTPYNMGVAEGAIAYTTTNLEVMGNAICRINALTQPTVDGSSTPISGATFVPSTDMYMVVQSLDGIVVQFYFLEI